MEGAMNKSGKYAVSEAIRRLKPEEIPSSIKKLKGIYYVYKFERVTNPTGQRASSGLAR